MTGIFSPGGKVEVGLTTSVEEEPRRIQAEDGAFRILVLGDFSGRRNRGVLEPLGRRRPIRVDRDELDAVLSKLEARLLMPVAGTVGRPIPAEFHSLEDFHPDSIFERVKAFSGLRQLRENLFDPAAFETAAKEIRGWGRPKVEPDPEESPEASESASDAEDVAGELLAAHASRPPAAGFPGSKEWDRYLVGLVEPHLAARDDSDQTALVARADESIGVWMREVLHGEDFQALEAAWRGLAFLLRRSETDSELQVFLLDVSKGELSADLRSAEDLRATAIHRLLVEEAVETPGGEPWALFAGNYTFEATVEDAALLARLGKIAKAANAPFLAAASPRLLGCESLAETPDPKNWNLEEGSGASEIWEAVRGLPESSFLGLALPRFLLRLPYGRETDPTEMFSFEELSFGAPHEGYLWGNPVFLCAYLIGRSFSENGWKLRPGEFRDVDGLPLHVFEEEGESNIKPCAEALLTERAADRILETGLMPILSVRGRDTVRLVRFQSISSPVGALLGPWGP